MLKDSHQSEKAKEKIRIARAKQVITNETRRKISLALRGRTPWNKGLTKETDPRIEAMALPKRGIPFSLERKMKLRGIPKIRTQEQINKFRETIQAQGHWAKGLTKETSPIIATSAEKKKGRNFAEEKYGKEQATKMKRRAGALGAISQIEKYDKEELFKLRKEWGIKGLIASNHSPNKCELYLQNLLNNLYPNEWKFVGDGEVKIGGKNPDFININGRKQLIEFFGERWHTKKDEEQERIEHFLQYGFDTLIIWESELRDKDALIIKIRNFIEESTKEGSIRR